MTRRITPRRLSLIAATVAALTLSACSSGGSDEPSDGGAAPSDAAQSVASGAAGSDDPSGSTGQAAAGGSADSGDAAAPASGSFTLGVTSYFLAHFAPGQGGGSNIGNALFTSPTAYDPETKEIRYAAAESVTSEDQTVWDIKLREGWTFHNGDPVTAQSFADSWNATANPANAMRNLLHFSEVEGFDEMNPEEGEPTADTLSGVEVVDEQNLRVTLTGPNPLFPYQLSGPAWAPIPKSALDDLDAFDQNPIGNGPFRMTGGGMKSGDQQIVLEAYEDYQGEIPAKTKSITVRSYLDSEAIYTDFTAGALDLMLVDGANLTLAQNDYPDQVVPVQYPALVYLGFPTWDKRFDDIKVRQAFSLAVDRQAIVEALLKGTATVAQGAGPEVLVGGGQQDCQTCTYDVERAKQLLAEAGGFSGKLVLHTYADPVMEEVTNAVANQLRTNLGIEATAETQPVSQLYDNFAEHSIEGLFTLYAGMNTPHLYAAVNALFTLNSSLNAADYESDEVTELIADAMAAGDDEAFTAGIQEASKAALADQALAPLYYPQGGLLHTPKLSGVQAELLGSANLAKIVVSE